MNIHSILSSFNNDDFDNLSAKEFMFLIENHLLLHGDIEKEVSVENRGDGKKGRVDIVFNTKNEKWGIEVDRKTPRYKSMEKLRNLKNCDHLYVILRSPFGIVTLK